MMQYRHIVLIQMNEENKEQNKSNMYTDTNTSTKHRIE